MNLVIEPAIHEYYTVTVNYEEYEWAFITQYPQPEPWKSIDKWCETTWGTMGIWGGPPGQWKRMGPKYFFHTNEERMLFVLRWS